MDAEIENKIQTQPDAGKPNPYEFEFGNKKFDLSSDTGRAHLRGWMDAITSTVGRQGNEMGKMRKFVQDMQPTADEETMLSQVGALRADGDHEKADALLLGWTKKQVAGVKDVAKKVRANDDSWEAYFAERKELLDLFPKDVIRKVSETVLEDIYTASDPFAVLDGFWSSKVRAAKTPEPAKSPMLQSGSQSRPEKAEGTSPEEPKGKSVEEILDHFSAVKPKV